MQIELGKSFVKDFDKLKNQVLKKDLLNAIQNVADAKKIQEIRGIKRLKGFDGAYRIKIKEYRIGVLYKKSTIHFITFDHRKDIYRNFP